MKQEKERRKEELAGRRLKEKEVAAKRAREKREQELEEKRHESGTQFSKKEKHSTKRKRSIELVDGFQGSEDGDSEVAQDEEKEVEQDGSDNEGQDTDDCSQASMADSDEEADAEAGSKETPCSKHPRKADPLSGLKDALEDRSTLGPETPFASREMLTAVCDEVCAEARRVAKSSRHEFLTEVLDMIGEALQEIHHAKGEMAERARHEASAAAADASRFTELADACSSRRSLLEAKKNDVAEMGLSLSTLKRNLAKATESERTASSSVTSADKAEMICLAERLAAAAASKAFETLESTGPPSRASEAKKLLKEVEGQMDVMNVKATLFPRVVNAAIAALQLTPESRSSFEDGALAAVEGCFKNYDREKEEERSRLCRATAAAKNRHEDATTDIEDIRHEIENCSKALRHAKDEQKECDSALRGAERKRKEHKEEVLALAKTAKTQAKALLDFGQMLRAFESLAHGT